MGKGVPYRHAPLTCGDSWEEQPTLPSTFRPNRLLMLGRSGTEVPAQSERYYLISEASRPTPLAFLAVDEGT